MRRRGPSKQRLRLGSRRHLCCRRRRYTDADAYCHSHGDRHGNSDGETDADPQIGAITKAASHAFAEALNFFLPRFRSWVTGVDDRLQPEIHPCTRCDGSSNRRITIHMVKHVG